LTELASVCDNADVKDNSHLVVKDVLDSFHQQCLDVDNKEFSLNKHMDKINSCFKGDSVEGIILALRDNGSEWASNQIQILDKMSPTSMKVTHRQVKEGRYRSFEECLMIEYRLSQRFIEGKDFYEGVRAVLVERDNKPQWSPQTLAEVTPEIVDSYFAPLENDEELIVKPISKL
jgi:3-hydroxyisobutyryl-CoA hydrolase